MIAELRVLTDTWLGLHYGEARRRPRARAATSVSPEAMELTRSAA